MDIRSRMTRLLAEAKTPGSAEYGQLYVDESRGWDSRHAQNLNFANPADAEAAKDFLLKNGVLPQAIELNRPTMFASLAEFEKSDFAKYIAARGEKARAVISQGEKDVRDLRDLARKATKEGKRGWASVYERFANFIEKWIASSPGETSLWTNPGDPPYYGLQDAVKPYLNNEVSFREKEDFWKTIPKHIELAYWGRRS